MRACGSQRGSQEDNEGPFPVGQRACELGALGGTRTPNLLIRRKLRAHRPPVAVLPSSRNDDQQCALLVVAERRGTAIIRPDRSAAGLLLRASQAGETRRLR